MKSSRPHDETAVKLLKNDHREVEAMFAEYEKLGERAWSSKQDLAQRICFALETHTMIEEALFFGHKRPKLVIRIRSR